MLLQHHETGTGGKAGEERGGDGVKGQGELSKYPEIGALVIGKVAEEIPGAAGYGADGDDNGAAAKEDLSPGAVVRRSFTCREFSATEPDITGVGPAGRFVYDGCDILVEAGDENLHMGEGQEEAVVIDGMMGGAHDPIAVAAPVAEDADRKIMEADVVAYLFEGAGDTEGGYAVAPGRPSVLCQGGGD